MSPRWLAINQKNDDVFKIFSRIGGSEYAKIELNEIKQVSSSDNGINWKALLHPGVRKVIIIGIVLAVFQQWCGINVIFNYAHEIFSATGDAGYFALAQIDTQRELYEDALDRIDRSLIKNWHNHKARHLKVAILRKSDRKKEALKFIEDSLSIDKFNMGCRFENFLLTNESSLKRSYSKIGI